MPVSRSTLDRARAGDERAFGDLVSPYSRELRLHCYRILGSLADAEDVLQETLTAAWRGLERFEHRSSLRTWLYSIATNRCLNAIRDGKRRRPAEPVPPFVPPEPSRRGEVTWLQPFPDALLEGAADVSPGPAARYAARESVELAFVAALQRLPARQTAALLLCDVLGFSKAETAAMLKTSPTSVKGVLQRARASVDGPVTAAPAPGSAEERRLARRFAEAFSTDDIDGVVALLTDDAWLAMPPAPHEYHGPAAIAGFLRASAGWRGARPLRLVPTRANTQPAFGCYHVHPATRVASPAGLLVLTMSGNLIGGITRFLDADLSGVFGLADPVT